MTRIPSTDGDRTTREYTRPMSSEDLRAVQAPLKQRYRDDPDAALVTRLS